MLVHRRGPPARLVKRVRIDHGRTEFRRGNGIGVDAEGEAAILFFPDIINIIQVDIIPEADQSIQHLLIFRRSPVFGAQRFQHVAVQHGRRRVDNIQHTLVDLRLCRVSRLPCQHGPQRQVRREQEKRNQHDGPQTHTHFFHIQSTPAFIVLTSDNCIKSQF
jgi:hypothetical protein